MRLAAAAAQFGRDLPAAVTRVEAIIGAARQAGAALLVLPDGTLGGSLDDLRCPDPATLPVALDPGDPVFDQIAALAGELVVCLGFCERAGPPGRDDLGRYNAAVCLSGAGIHGRHRKVHLVAGEVGAYAPGDDFAAFDTPVGRVGMLIDYDKTFPEAARALALDGAQVLACLSAWPASATDPARRVVKDRQARLFDLYDCARAAENQLVLASANQTGSSGRLRFLGQAKVVGPGGEVRARTWSKAGLAVADIDVPSELARARRVLTTWPSAALMPTARDWRRHGPRGGRVLICLGQKRRGDQGDPAQRGHSPDTRPPMRGRLDLNRPALPHRAHPLSG